MKGHGFSRAGEAPYFSGFSRRGSSSFIAPCIPSGAKALFRYALYGTPEGVPFQIHFCGTAKAVPLQCFAGLTLVCKAGSTKLTTALLHIPHRFLATLQRGLVQHHPFAAVERHLVILRKLQRIG